MPSVSVEGEKEKHVMAGSPVNVNIIHYISHIKIISDSNQIIDGNNEEPMKQGDNNDDYLIKKVSEYKFFRNMASINTLY